MNEMKRVLALLLCVVMLVGVMPVGALAAETETTAPSEALEVQAAEAAAAAATTEAAEIETSVPETTGSEAEEAAYYEAEAEAAFSATGTDYLFVATDRHANTSIIGNIIDNMEDNIEDQLDYLALGGDMDGSGNSHPEYDSSTVLAEVTGAASYMSAKNVDIVAGIHDMNVNDDAGIVLPYQGGCAQIFEGDRYYVYGVEEYCISDDSKESNWSAQAQKFVDWANGDGIDTSKAIIVVSHYPLHAKRDDNDGAYIWHTALNQVATNGGSTVVRDIVFFHGHNHTVDSKEYVYNVGDTMSIQNGSSTTSEAIRYTYATAGYLNQNGDATLVTITDDTISLDKYGTSGSGSSMATVTRAVQETTGPETTEPEATESTDTTEPEVTAPERIEVSGTDAYTVGDTLTVTVKGYTYSTEGTTSEDIALSDCTVTVSCPEGHDCTLDTVMENIAIGEDGNYHQVTVTYMGVSDDFQFSVGEAADLGNSELGVGVSVNAAVTGTVTVAESANENVASAMETAEVTAYKAYDITTEIAMDPGNYATVTLPIPEGVENPVVYYVSDDGATVTDMKAEDNGDGTVSFVTDHFSSYVVGNGTNIEVEDPEEASGTTGDKKTVYVLTSSISSGNEYLIVNSNAAGSYYALANNSGSVAASGVTIKTDSTIGTYIELDDATDELWTVGGSYTFQNDGVYLGYTSSGSWNPTYTFGLSTTARTWSYSTNNNRLSTSVGNWSTTTYYLQYSSGWTWTNSSSASGRSVYFYEKQEIDTTVSGTYSIAGEDITTIVTAGDTATLTSTLTFTPDSGTATTEDVSTTATYEIVSDPNGVMTLSGNTVTYTGNTGKALVKVSYESDFGTVTNYITVNASAPYYSIELHKANVADDGTVTVGNEITEPVALKKIETGDTYSVWAVVKEHTSTAPDGADLGDVDDDRIKWSVDNENIAIVDPATGIITFTGEEYGTFELTATYLDENGDPLCEDTIVISVSENSGIVPGDGTDDFPEYPNEGAVRINKTADALGNFSETGIAKVELSMTGVPYTTGSEIDVVLMLDMTGSMDDVSSSTSEPTGYVRIDATIEASKAFVESIVKNEDGTFNKNRIGVYVFNKNGAATLYDFGTVDADKLTTIYSDLETIKDDHFASGGTPYDDGLAKCQEVLAEAKTDGTGDERKQFTVFMTDGVPTSYAYVNGTTYGTHSSASDIAGMLTSASDYAIRDTDYKYEYYSTEMKKAGVTVYSVGIGLNNENNAWSGSATQCNNLASALLNDISGPAYEESQPDAVGTSTLSKMYTGTDFSDITDKYFFSVDDDNASNMSKVFSGIAQSIKEAATNVNVTDEIGNDYTLNFSLPGDVTKEAAGMDEFDIQVVEYTLDSDHERDGDPAVLENFTFNADGTLKSHTVDGTACSSCSHVTLTNGVVTAINGTYFQYEVKTNTDGTTSEFLYWHSDKLTNKELALQYYAYLDNSAGESDPNNQVPAGSYYTNEEATVTYTNFQGNECELEFPKPQMTWSGAQVTYRFYLVDKYGNPVNRAGKVIPFAEAITVYQSEPIAVTWNSLNEGESKMLAQDLLANDKVPGVYSLYDENAYYEIRVYQTEGVDDNGANYNYFIIEGSDQDTLNEARGVTGASLTTTKVYNTVTSGIRYVNYGAYSETSKDANGNNFTPTSARSGKSYTPTITNNIDYANTTVAFGVLWTPSLAEDTIIVDYGLDVEVDVSINDMVETQLVGVRNDKPDAAINTGVVASPAKTTSANITIGDDDRTIGTAKVLNNAVIQFSLNKPTDAAASNAMLFDEPAVVYYESMYTWLNGSNYVDDVMYSSLTIIPASTVYYEDEYVTLKTFTKQADGTYKESAGWDTNSKAATATQAVDRPGTTANMENVEDWDANNLYGYDGAYGNCATYSMDNAAKINVEPGKYGTATFDFYGTGFDIISSTTSTTGSITVDIDGENEENDKHLFVDTYYGYTCEMANVTYVYTNNGWEYESHVVSETAAAGSYADMDAYYAANGEDVALGTEVTIHEPYWTKATDSEGALYQVPVIKASGLPYGKYSVTIRASYSEYFDNADAGSYDFYLDAIRIYDPTGVASGAVDNTTVSNAYKADGEGWAKYSEVRDIILAANTFGGEIDSAVGAIFIDQVSKEYDIVDYKNYGPNNELYLEKGQMVAFILDPSLQYSSYALADVQIGLKSANEALGEVLAELRTYTENTDGTYAANSSTASISAGTTATDRYYSIGAHVNKSGETILSIRNTGTGILSVTNIKLTFTAEPVENGTGVGTFAMTRSVADGILMTLNAADDVVEEPEEVLDAELNVSLNKKSVKVGGTVQVKVTTSADVDALSVNGQEITKFKQNNKTGKRTWTVKVTAEEAGDLDIEVIAYSADGKTLDTVVETVEVTAKKSGNVNKTVGQLLGKLFG